MGAVAPHFSYGSSVYSDISSLVTSPLISDISTFATVLVLFMSSFPSAAVASLVFVLSVSSRSPLHVLVDFFNRVFYQGSRLFNGRLGHVAHRRKLVRLPTGQRQDRVQHVNFGRRSIGQHTFSYFSSF